jgi:hypothetical protein
VGEQRVSKAETAPRPGAAKGGPVAAASRCVLALSKRPRPRPTRNRWTRCRDLTFAILPPIDSPYATLDLIADRYVLLVPAGSPLAEAGVRPDAAALEPTPMIGSQWERRTIDGPPTIEARTAIQLARPLPPVRRTAEAFSRGDFGGTVAQLPARWLVIVWSPVSWRALVSGAQCPRRLELIQQNSCVWPGLARAGQ